MVRPVSVVDPRARQRIPRVPGHYWVIPERVGFAVRVFVHSYAQAAGVPTIELCASGIIVAPIQALVEGWEWYAEKPDTDPADPEFVAAIARGHELTGRKTVWQDAATALRNVIQRACLLPCSCRDHLPRRGTIEWDALQAGRTGTAPVSLCLRCSAQAAIAKAVEAEDEAD